MKVEALDARDPPAMRAWHDTYYQAEIFGREWSAPYMLPERRAEFLAEGIGELVLGFSGRVDGEVATTGVIVLPQRDNLHLAWLQVHTHPSRRRRGHGSAMLAHLTAVARKHDRRTLSAETSVPYDGPPDGAGHPGVGFLTHRGFKLGLGDVMRVLDLPAEESMLQRLVDEAAPHHVDYELRQFSGPVPEDIVSSFGELVGSLTTEAPVGEFEKKLN